MKKKWILTFSVLCAFAGSTLAQPVISNLVSAPLGTKSMAYPIPGSITEGTAGAAQTWDYSAIPYDPSTYYFQNVSYAGLSQALKDTFPNGTTASELYMGGNLTATLVFRTDANVMEYLGLNTTKFASPDTQLVFPFNYQETHAGFTYDAYGTLKTPFGTYNNTVRLREVVGSDYKYDYWQFAPVYRLLMEYKVDTVTQAMSEKAFFNFDVAASLQNIAAPSTCTIYPNPASGSVFIQQDAAGETVLTITDILGKRSLEHTFTSDATTPYKLDISALQQGVYLVNIQTASSSASRIIAIQ